MSDDSDLEKTESPSERRLEKAHEEGQVVRSKELSTFLLMFAAAGAFSWTGGQLVQGMSHVLHSGLDIPRADAFNTGALGHRLYTLSYDALMVVMPVLLVLLIVSVAAPIVLGGWLFSVKGFAPKFGRLDPMSGLKRVISLHGLGELVKAIAKSVVLGIIAGWVLWNKRVELLSLTQINIMDALANLGHLLSVIFFSLTGGLALIAAADVPFQLWHHYTGLKMTKQEVRDEAREMDGDPQMKARIRSQQREMARRRMMAQVPKADVIVTNPTHYAVALSYKESMQAPRVIAKGSALMAQRIREIGKANNIPILEAPPLARALHHHTELGDEIPATLYSAVALVMAYVFQLRTHRAQGGDMPMLPEVLPVPAELDPGADA
ncbi:MAG: flagellar biosynthesis protein FlhB [Pseudomonadota bacterium]